MSEYIYLVDFDGGKPQLTRVEAIDQNNKTYLSCPESARSILGDVLVASVVISKAYTGVFDSMLKALSFLHSAATAHIYQCQQATAKARNQVASLEQLIEEVEQANDPS